MISSISNLPLDASGHQFWVGSVDFFGNVNVVDMPSTGVIPFDALVAPTLSNVTNIFSTYSDFSGLPPQEQYDILQPIGQDRGDWIFPMVVTSITTSTEYLDYFEIEMAENNTFTTNPTMQMAYGAPDGNGNYESLPIRFMGEDGTTYYFRARIVDRLGRQSSWSNIVNETCGDTTPPNEVGSANVDFTIDGHTVKSEVDLSSYTRADDHGYFEWWLNTSSTHPGGNGIKTFDNDFVFTNRYTQTVWIFVAAVDRSGNRSTNYTNNVGNTAWSSADYWTNTGDVTDISGDPIVDVTDRGVEDENGNTIIDFTSGSGNTNYNAVLEGVINLGTGGAFHLTDNTVSFAGTPIVGMEIIGRGLKLYESANRYALLEKNAAGTINFEIVGGTIKTSAATSYVEMDSTGIKGYNSSTQRFQLSSDGSGWLGATDAIYWDTSGNLSVDTISAGSGTIGGFTIGSDSLTSTNIGIHSSGYSEGAEILIGHATAYASAEIGFKADGSGKVADGNFLWDASGNVTMAGTFTSTAVITGGTIQTATSGARVVMSSSGIIGYDASNARYTLSNDGSGWIGASDAIYWDTSGNLSVDTISADTGDIGGFTISATSLTSTNIGLHSGGGAMILLGHATVYASASIGFQNDGSGKLASDNINWDSSGNIIFGGTITSYATITGGVFQTSTGNAKVAIDSTTGLVAANSSGVQTAEINIDGSGWFGLTGTKAIEWDSSGTAQVGGWYATNAVFTSAASGARIELDATNNRNVIYDATQEVVAMGFLGSLPKNPVYGWATAATATTLTDSNQNWSTNELQNGTIEILEGTGNGQTRNVSSNTATVITVPTWTITPDTTSKYKVSDYGNWTTSDYGFWAREGDHLSIDGDVRYDNGDWIIQHDASYLVEDVNDNIIIRLGTDTSEKGLFIYNVSGTQLAKFISDEIYVGASGNSLQYTTANGLIIDGDITSNNYPAQPFDEDALLLWALDSFPLDQSGNDNDGNTSYGANVTYVDGGVGGGYCTSFPNGTAVGDYLQADTVFSHQECTITFWAKSSDTGVNYVYTSAGQIRFNASVSRPLLSLGASNYRYFDDNNAQDDGEWHFWCVYIAGSAQSDINDSELYVDTTQINTYSTQDIGAPSAWSNIRVGYSFNGDMQDFRVYSKQLSSFEMLAIYNNPMNKGMTRISGDKITTGVIESTNWGSSAGSQFDLDAGEFYLGGSSSPKLSWNGSTLSIDGSITAASGNIGGWDITSTEINITPISNVTARLNSNGYISFGDPAPTSYGSNVGGWFGIDSGSAKISLYNSGTSYMQWDGTDLEVLGGTITGGTVQTSVANDRIVMASDTLKFYNSSGTYVGGFVPGSVSGFLGFDLNTANTVFGFYYDSNEYKKVVFEDSVTNYIGEWLYFSYLHTSGVKHTGFSFADGSHATLNEGAFVIDFTDNEQADLIIMEDRSGDDWVQLSVDSSSNLNITPNGGEVNITGNIDVTGSYKMDNADIINTSGYQTGVLKTRQTLLFGNSSAITRSSQGTTTTDAKAVNGAVNTRGYRMIRAGTVTGISIQFILTASPNTVSGTSYFRATVQDGGTNTSMYTEVTGLVGLSPPVYTGSYSTSNSFTVSAGDTVNVELSLVHLASPEALTVDEVAIIVEFAA